MKAHCMLWEPHLAQTDVWQIGCALHRNTGTPLMWHQLWYVAQTGPEWIWSKRECVNNFFKDCFYEQILCTHQPIAKDRQRTYNQSGSGPWTPTASRWDLTIAYNPQRWVPVKLSHTVMNKLKKLSKSHTPEPFFALFFAGTTCEELHSRAAAKSTSSSRPLLGSRESEC